MGSVDNGIPTGSHKVDKLARKEEMMKQKKKPFEKCPVCGGELVEKEVEKRYYTGVCTQLS